MAPPGAAWSGHTGLKRAKLLMTLMLAAFLATGAEGQQGFQGAAPSCWTYDLASALVARGLPSVNAWSPTNSLTWVPNMLLDGGSPARFLYLSTGGMVACVDLLSRQLKWALAWTPTIVDYMSDGRTFNTSTTLVSLSDAKFIMLRNARLRMLYVGGYDNAIHAVDIDTGREVWKYQHPAADVGIYPESDGERVFAASSDYSVFALNATTGALLWSRFFRRWTLPGSIVADGILVRMDATNMVYGLNTTTGALLWRVATEAAPGVGPAPGVVYSADDNTVFVRDDHGFLYAIHVSTGSMRWRIAIDPELPAVGTYRPALTVGAGLVVVRSVFTFGVTGKSSTYAFNQTTGEFKWRRDDSSQSDAATACYDAIAVTPQGPFVVCAWARADDGAQDNRLVAYDVSGTEIWSVSTGFIQAVTFGSILYDDAAGLRYLLDASGALVALATRAESACRGASFVALPPAPPASPPSPPQPPSPPAGNSLRITVGGPLCWRSETRLLPYCTPGTDGVRIYERSATLVQAMDPTSGIILWRYWCGDGNMQGTNMVVADGVVYTGCSDGRVHALDAETGVPVWVTGALVGNPLSAYPGFGLFAALEDGVLYVGGPPPYIYAFNATDGSILWSHTVEDRAVTTGQSVGLADGILYTVAGPQYFSYTGPASLVLALNASTGEELWSRPLGFNVELEGDVVVTGDGLFIFPTNNGELRAYSAGAGGGDAVWSVIISTSFMTAISYYDGIIYAGDGKGVMRAVSVSDQRILWETPLQPLVDELVPVPSSTKMDAPAQLYNGRLYVATNQGVVVLNATTGAVLWTDGMIGRVGGAPILIDHGGDVGVQLIYPVYPTSVVSTVTGACPARGGLRPPPAIAPTRPPAAVQQQPLSPPPPPPSPPLPPRASGVVPPPPSPSACAACLAACNGSSDGGGEATPRTLHVSLLLSGVSYRSLLASPRAQLRLAAAVAKESGGTLGSSDRVRVSGLEAAGGSAVIVRLSVSGLAAVNTTSVSAVAVALQDAALSGALQRALVATKEPPLVRAAVRTLVAVVA